MPSTAQIKISLFMVFLLMLQTNQFSIQFNVPQKSIQEQYSQSSQDSYKANGDYFSNMTETELRYVSNAIGAAERRYNESSLTDIAKSISANLQNVFGNPWSVLVLNKTVTKIGIGALAKQNKIATFIKAGSYELSYVVLQKGDCIYPNSSLDNNDTKTAWISGKSASGYLQRIKAIVDAASTFGGNDIMQNANYIKNQTRKTLNFDWNAIIVEPAVTSGSYICSTYYFWTMFIRYVDFGWNYYVFGGDSN